ncbi:MAG TPA: response regulator transcription factor [Thermoanaerobaculia bacterium]|nr:response regulator transcription factor [Thermoanaerobaculia bacterium]
MTISCPTTPVVSAGPETSAGAETFLNLAVYATGATGGETIDWDATPAGLDALARSRFMTAPIGVFIVSRNRLFADALASLLARNGELTVVGVAQEPEDLAFASDVLLIDADGFVAGSQEPAAGPGPAGMPPPDRAVASLRDAGERGAGCKPMVFGVKSEDERLIDLIEAGARGYVLEGTSPADLVAAIRAVHAGRSRCSARVAAAVVARIKELEGRRVEIERHHGEPLTAREREVLGWIATGRGNKEIGRRLGISVQTVKNHVHSLLAKLGARRRREALRIAYELGVLAEWGDAMKDAEAGPAARGPR